MITLNMFYENLHKFLRQRSHIVNIHKNCFQYIRIFTKDNSQILRLTIEYMVFSNLLKNCTIFHQLQDTGLYHLMLSCYLVIYFWNW